MFETNDSAERVLPITFARNGNRNWDYCAVNEMAPWYLIEYEHSQFGSESKFLALISTNEHLFNMQQNDKIKITQAHLVSPSNVNQSTSWQVSMLNKVVQTHNKNYPKAKQITFYELVDGRKLSFPIRIKKKILQSKWVTIFTAPHR